jgi:hypothetical protein
MVLKPGVKISILVKTKFAKNVLKRFTKNITIYDGLATVTGTLDRQINDEIISMQPLK